MLQPREFTIVEPLQILRAATARTNAARQSERRLADVPVHASLGGLPSIATAVGRHYAVVEGVKGILGGTVHLSRMLLGVSMSSLFLERFGIGVQTKMINRKFGSHDKQKKTANPATLLPPYVQDSPANDFVLQGLKQVLLHD